YYFFFFQAEDGIRDLYVTGVQTCALPISPWSTLGGGTGSPRFSLPRKLYALRRARRRRLNLAKWKTGRGIVQWIPRREARTTVRSEERRVGKEWGVEAAELGKTKTHENSK